MFNVGEKTKKRGLANPRPHAIFRQQMCQKALNRILTLPNYSTGPGRLISSRTIGSRNNRFCEQFKHCTFIIPYATRMPPTQFNSLRRNPLRHLTFETPFSCLYSVLIPWTQGHPGTQRAKGTQGNPKGPKGSMGPFRVIPKPFRIESHFEV